MCTLFSRRGIEQGTELWTASHLIFERAPDLELEAVTLVVRDEAGPDDNDARGKVVAVWHAIYIADNRSLLRRHVAGGARLVVRGGSRRET